MQKTFPIWLLAFSLPSVADVELSKQNVLADFRQTDVQALADAITLVSDQQIQARSAEHLEQILSFAPNVNFAAGSSRARFFQIRGIGEESQFIDPVNPSIGLVIDGIDMTGLGSAAALFDVAQVEILRGSQGTRFGANALGGMINIQSADPDSTATNYLSGKIGNYQSYGLGGAFTGRLNDQLQGRLAIQRYQSNGYMQNDYLDRDDTNEQQETLVRGKLHWQPAENTHIKLTYLFADMNNGYDAFTVDNSRHSLADEPGKDQQTTHALALSLDKKINSSLTFFTQLSGSKTDALYSYDEDWVNPSYGELWGKGFDAYQRDYQRLSLDMRLLSGETGRIFANSTDWVIGAYALQRNEKLARDYSWNAGLIYHNELHVNSAALYGELTTHFGQTTRLVYGLRAENWRNELTDNAHSMDANDTDLDTHTDEWLSGGKISLEQDIGLQHLSYLSFSRGSKAGGINTAPTISVDKRIFDREFNHTTELGLKSLWLNNKLSTRVALFYTKRQDQQAKSSYPIPGTANFQDYFTNAAKSENYGVELESQWQLTERLNWALSYGYLQAKFIDYSYQTDQGLVDKSGRGQLHSPKHSGATALSYAFSDYWSLRLEAEGKDKFYFEAAQDAMSHAYLIYHARLSYENTRYMLALSGRNLADKDIEIRGYSGFNNDSQNPASDRYVQLGEPRLVMLEGRINF